MTEDDAKNLIAERFGADKVDRVDAFLDLVRDENGRQNLIAPSTVDTVWVRHGLDSAQLLFHVEQSGGSWLDIGTGGGFPGIVIAMLYEGHVTMVEPRRKRADFLRDCIERLAITQATVVTSKVENVTGKFAIISARAVASVEKLLQAAGHCATPDTQWALPRGRIEPHDIDRLRRDRSRLFHVKHSVTDPESMILVVKRNKDAGR